MNRIIRMPTITAELYRFPDRGGGIFYGCIYRSVVQTDSTVVSYAMYTGSSPVPATQDLRFAGLSRQAKSVTHMGL